MPAAIKLQAKYADELQVIFVESQGASSAAAELFALDMGWFGTNAIWTTEAPFRTGLGGLPSCAVLDAEGKILLVGNNGALGNKIESAIDDALRASDKMPKSMHKSLKKSWSAFHKNDLAKALTELAKVENSGKDYAADAREFHEQITANVQGRLEQITWLIDNGYIFEADDELIQLGEDAEDVAEFAEPIAALVAGLAAEELAESWEAAKAFAKLEKQLFKKGPDEKLGKKFAKLADKYATTKVALRALHYADIMR